MIRFFVVSGALILLGCSAASTPLDNVALLDASLSDARHDANTDVPSISPTGALEFDISTQTYGQGQRHLNWNAENPTLKNLELDLYQPKGIDGLRPALIVIHGGGFKNGNRKVAPIQSLAEYFVRRGWVVISPSYRLENEHGTIPAEFGAHVDSVFPAGAQREQIKAMYPAARDIKAASRWLHANAARLHVSTTHIAATGGSAGAFLAVMLGVTADGDYGDELLDIDPTLISTNLSSNENVQAVVDLWGGPSLPQILFSIDGLNRFDQNDAPISIVHGTQDKTVPFSFAEDLRTQYSQSGAYFEWHPLNGEGHSAWGATVDGRTINEHTHDFLSARLGLRSR